VRSVRRERIGVVRTHGARGISTPIYLQNCWRPIHYIDLTLLDNSLLQEAFGKKARANPVERDALARMSLSWEELYSEGVQNG